MHASTVSCFAALFTLIMASAACAEDCSNAQTTIDINACAGRNYQAADRKLNQAFGQLLANAKQSDRDVQGADYSYEQALHTAQRAWIAFRDADCKQPPPPLSGSIATMEQLDCLTENTIQRTNVLNRRLAE